MATEKLLTGSPIVASGGPVSRAVQAGRGEAAEPFPEVYAMWVDGDCCAPEIPHDCHVLCDTTRAPKLGDFVVIHFTPEAAAQFGYAAWVKRLVMMQRPASQTRKPKYASNVAPCLVVESLNPRKCFVLDWAWITAVHHCGGKVPTWVNMIPNPKLEAERVARKAGRAA